VHYQHCVIQQCVKSEVLHVPSQSCPVEGQLKVA